MRAPKFFANQEDFRAWLEKHHDSETELLVGFYRVGSGKPSMTWPESVDQALCFGWIDGVRKSMDEERYTIRFSRRKAGSIWSAINIQKVEDLTRKGLMRPEGFAAFEKRKLHRSAVYSYEQGPVDLSEEFLEKFKSHEKAWKFFTSQAPWYRKKSSHVVMRAKHEETRLRRLDALISASAEGRLL